MSFESRVAAFSERFLSSRSNRLIVAPALADLQFEEGGAGAVVKIASPCSARWPALSILMRRNMPPRS